MKCEISPGDTIWVEEDSPTVGVCISDGGHISAVILTPEKARKLARKLLRAADRVERGEA